MEQKEGILNYVSHYLANDGDLNNVSFGFSRKDLSNGMFTAHEYALKDVRRDLNGDLYFVFVNPWDDADCLKLSLSETCSYMTVGCPFGYTVEEIQTFFETRVEGWEPEQDE